MDLLGTGLPSDEDGARVRHLPIDEDALKKCCQPLPVVLKMKKKVFRNKETKEHDDNLLLQQSYEVAVDSTQRLRIVRMEAFRLKYSQVMVMIMMITIISLYIKYSFGPFCSSATGWFLSDERYGCRRVTATGDIVHQRFIQKQHILSNLKLAK